MAENFVPPLLEAVLIDYQRNVPAAREPEVLSTMATIVNKLGVHITGEIPKIFDAVFECTLNMINKVCRGCVFLFYLKKFLLLETDLTPVSLRFPPLFLGLWGVSRTSNPFFLPAPSCHLPVLPSIPSHCTSPVQADLGLHHLGLQAYYEERGWHRSDLESVGMNLAAR